MSDRDLERDDPNFVADLEHSKIAVSVAAAWLRSRGWRVDVPPTSIRPTIQQRHDYSDKGDLYISAGGLKRRVEVKCRDFEFNDGASYPYRTVRVDARHLWDNAKPKPAAYLILDRSMTAVAIVQGSTANRWELTTCLDRKKNRMRTFYDCPLALVRFERLPASISAEKCA